MPPEPRQCQASVVPLYPRPGTQPDVQEKREGQRELILGTTQTIVERKGAQGNDDLVSDRLFFGLLRPLWLSHTREEPWVLRKVKVQRSGLCLSSLATHAYKANEGIQQYLFLIAVRFKFHGEGTFFFHRWMRPATDVWLHLKTHNDTTAQDNI
jgi:hypothetical protein